MDAVAGTVQGGRGMIRVMVGYWVVCMAVISFIICIAQDGFKEKLLVVGATGIYLAALLFGLWMIGV